MCITILCIPTQKQVPLSSLELTLKKTCVQQNLQIKIFPAAGCGNRPQVKQKCYQNLLQRLPKNLFDLEFMSWSGRSLMTTLQKRFKDTIITTHS